jgi:hypothetical protein
MMKGWEAVFGTASHDKVSQELDQQELKYSWKEENTELQVLNKTSAVEKHPVTGDTVWFNHLLVQISVGAWCMESECGRGFLFP